ncbi:MAG TPA: methionyl-tRNA formyltransferase [Bryobacteraceae bacterium]|nr:methionyl-tRNA formyltransferase [Bryobacteraceae bacterium]
MRLVFLGTPAFAVPTLERVVQAGHEILAVVTQPDRPRGRGQKAAPPPVKEAALRLGLAVFQPERVRRPEAVELLRGFPVDAMVVVGYGQIIPQSIIDMAPLGIINVHGSLLPRYRGAGPVQWAILNGERRTGVTTMRIDAGLDTGDMLLKAETDIGADENAIELGERLAVMGADLLVETLTGLERGTIVPEKQDSSQATFAPLLKKEDGLIDWSRDAQSIHNRVLGLQPWPGAYTGFRGQTLHVWKSKPGAVAGLAGQPGRVVRIKPLMVSCGSGVLELIEMQLEGRKRLSASDFANGQRIGENEVLGGVA